MKSLKKFIPTLAMLLSVSLIFAQETGAAETAAADGPSWMANPIGSIIGLILLIAMFAGMAKAALSKQ